MTEHYPHRDIGRPHTSFQTTVWCALQDLNENQTLIILPEAYRDGRHDQADFNGQMNYYQKEPGPPEDWGYGRPLKIPLRFGDILLFHGDHFHSSPVPSRDLLRLSWVTRVVAECYDDMGWYASRFSNIANFIPNTNGAQTQNSVTSGENLWRQWTKPPDSPLANYEACSGLSIGWQFLGWMVNMPEKIPKFISESTEAMFRLPFAEDRFLWPHFAAQKYFPQQELDRDIEQLVIERTENYFWACIYGGLALGAGRRRLARKAFDKARELARKTRLDCETNPIDYFEILAKGSSSLMPVLYSISPEDVDELIRLYMEGLVPKGCHGDTVELLQGIPYPKDMFRPRYPFIEFLSPIADEKKNIMRLISQIFKRTMASHAPKRHYAFPERKLRVGENWLPF